jgi:hypothetical protein
MILELNCVISDLVSQQSKIASKISVPMDIKRPKFENFHQLMTHKVYKY